MINEWLVLVRDAPKSIIITIPEHKLKHSHIGMQLGISITQTYNSPRNMQSNLNSHKRPVGLIAPPFIISFLATGN